jgi:hypothetical protein
LLQLLQNTSIAYNQSKLAKNRIVHFWWQIDERIHARMPFN